jgi:hypothetical protein
MSVITITCPARCKDCIFLKAHKFGKLRRSICTNVESPRYNINPYLSQVRLRDLVCDKWKLF